MYCFNGINIDIIAPSSGCDNNIWYKVEKLVGKKNNNRNTKTSNEQVFVNPKDKFNKLNHQLFSNNRILWALRGGYGIDKVMPFIIQQDYSKINKKIIIGYSDLTALQIYFSQKYNWKCISGCMLKDFLDTNKSEKSKNTILNYLKGKIQYLKLHNLIPLNKIAKNSKIIEGKTTGGNLTAIQSGIGTEWQIYTNNKILFLEDVNVDGFRLDRILNHLKNAGLLHNVKAIIFGDFGNNKENLKVLKHFANEINIPIFKTNEFGHQKENLPFGINFNGTIKKDKNKYVVVME